MFCVTSPAGAAACYCMNYKMAALVAKIAASVCWSCASPADWDMVQGLYNEKRLRSGKIGGCGWGSLGKLVELEALLSSDSNVYLEEDGLGAQ